MMTQLQSVAASAPHRRQKRLATILVLVLLISIGCAIQQPIHAKLTTETLTELLDVLRQEKQLPGVRAAVFTPDDTLIVAATGLADVENDISLDMAIGMPGGSTGKTFVAALTMLLVEDGVLGLDDLASKWVGEESWFKDLPNSDEIQLRHLLSHSSGLSDYPNTRRYWVLSIWRAIRRGGIVFSREELIEMVNDKPPLNPVGQGFAYTDSGYIVLGKILEAASGRDYYELLDERILTPHNLQEIQFQNKSVLTNIAAGYTRGARNIREDGTMKVDPISEWTGGGLVTNPTMLAKFYRLLANGEIVEPATFKVMCTEGWQNPEAPAWHYGLGLFVVKPGNFVEHGGMWMGYRSHVRHYVDERLTIAVQTNRDGPVDMENITDQIKRLSEL